MPDTTDRCGAANMPVCTCDGETVAVSPGCINVRYSKPGPCGMMREAPGRLPDRQLAPAEPTDGVPDGADGASEPGAADEPQTAPP